MEKTLQKYDEHDECPKAQGRALLKGILEGRADVPPLELLIPLEAFAIRIPPAQAQEIAVVGRWAG